MLAVDLNCDMGESFGAWQMGSDAELMKFVSSANIACGFHAGDAATMRRTVENAIENGVAIGAHPGYPDLQGFGRRRMSMQPDEVRDIILYQVAALKGICEAAGGRLHHVKPHGALYNQAAADRELAAAITEAVRSLDDDLIFYGLSGSSLISEASAAGLRTASEVFADRGYSADGKLMPRGTEGALIDEPDAAAAQAIMMVERKHVTAANSELVKVEPDTICIHGDGPNALELASAIRRALDARNIVVKAP